MRRTRARGVVFQGATQPRQQRWTLINHQATTTGTGPATARSGCFGGPARGARQTGRRCVRSRRTATVPGSRCAGTHHRRRRQPARPCCLSPCFPRPGPPGPVVQACFTRVLAVVPAPAGVPDQDQSTSRGGPFPPSQRVSVYILSLVDFDPKSNPEPKTRHLLTVKQRKLNPLPKRSRFREVVVVPESIGGGQNAKVEPL
jgi:hypothetical protein